MEFLLNTFLSHMGEKSRSAQSSPQVCSARCPRLSTVETAPSRPIALGGAGWAIPHTAKAFSLPANTHTYINVHTNKDHGGTGCLGGGLSQQQQE